MRDKGVRMSIRTSWVKPPQTIQGLDHLGTHAPCIDLYSRLLPGITNVTDRARYYTIYPWFIWAFDQRYKHSDSQKFEQLFRRADCLLTWISERHSQCTDRDTMKHSIGMIGRQRLVPALANLQGNKTLRLSDYATREDSENRYFKNRLGGLGQYYIGTLQDLGVLDIGERGWITYTRERGQALAEAVDRYVDGDRFFEALEKDRVSSVMLDELERFCFCHLSSSNEEHALLADLLFERTNIEEGGGQRRLTLALALSAVDASSDSPSEPITLDVFERAVYGRSFGAGRVWKIPSRLEDTAQAWALYVRNDLLSIAVQGVFAIALKKLEESDLRFQTGRDFEGWVSTSSIAKRVSRRFDGKSFGEALRNFSERLAPIDQWHQPMHEWTFSRRILESFTIRPDETSDVDVLVDSVRLLMALAARTTSEDAYRASPFAPGFLDPYPINLQTFSGVVLREWSGLSIPQLLGWLMNRWGVETHLSVALRKLRHNPQAAFRVHPTELGLQVEPEIPPPTRTNPRMRQGLQMLRDLNAITDTEDGSRLTDFGAQILREVTHD